ncbi:hypothetical protein BDK51DRAFT_41601 [Blyttiomyces helicus]|uniref:Uncharacterized protein n=1 Tax=Blyttiomyces helicus TaxID=388810 RepID=A0A4P9WTJ3_9FUNG|nr:hypothetical protein BDK51DRAFT_41601 [Blyttiomyces helicus]|eukprot:RKO94386.1 hypothetical protein BDK51DRAFT_41601 [Blyttiomyces helicus]
MPDVGTLPPIDLPNPSQRSRPERGQHENDPWYDPSSDPHLMQFSPALRPLVDLRALEFHRHWPLEVLSKRLAIGEARELQIPAKTVGERKGAPSTVVSAPPCESVGRDAGSVLSKVFFSTQWTGGGVPALRSQYSTFLRQIVNANPEWLTRQPPTKVPRQASHPYLVNQLAPIEVARRKHIPDVYDRLSGPRAFCVHPWPADEPRRPDTGPPPARETLERLSKPHRPVRDVGEEEALMAQNRVKTLPEQFLARISEPKHAKAPPPHPEVHVIPARTLPEAEIERLSKPKFRRTRFEKGRKRGKRDKETVREKEAPRMAESNEDDVHPEKEILEPAVNKDATVESSPVEDTVARSNEGAGETNAGNGAELGVSVNVAIDSSSGKLDVAGVDAPGLDVADRGEAPVAEVQALAGSDQNVGEANVVAGTDTGGEEVAALSGTEEGVGEVMLPAQEPAAATVESPPAESPPAESPPAASPPADEDGLTDAPAHEATTAETLASVVDAE